MKFKKITTAATFIGALIGAGFASGREISLYFGHTSVMTPIFAGIFLTLFSYLFLIIGTITGGKPSQLLHKGGRISDWVIRICNAVTFCAMIAGSEEVVYALFNFHGGSVISGILALLIVLWGVEKLKFSNFIIVPIIIVMVAVLFLKNHSLPPVEKFSIFPAFTYCAMNIIGGGYLIATFSADFTKKDCLQTSLICGTVLTALLLAVFFTIQNHLDEAMPLISTAAENGFAVLGNLIMYLAIFTTLTGSLSISSGNKFIPACIIVALSFTTAILGFEKIVNNFYPILGVAGGAVSLLYLFYFLHYKKYSNTQALVPNIGNDTKLIATPPEVSHSPNIRR